MDEGAVGAFPDTPGAFGRPEAGKDGENGGGGFDFEGVRGRSRVVRGGSRGVDAGTGMSGKI